MAVTSIVLSVVAVVLTGLGVLLVPVPIAGAVFAFGAPAVALTGVVLGGRAMSERRRAGQSTDVALVGVVLCSLAFMPALLCALTCGVCNALCSAGPIEVRQSFGTQFGSPIGGDASTPFGPASDPAQRAPLPPPPARDGGVSAPAPAQGLPPPPLPPGPRD